MDTLTVVFSAAGGLAPFLYGLRTLSDALKRAVGERMRELLERLTATAYRGALVGALTSGILQSSSMTMVLLIGLINAGALTLTQGIGVMLGSEIGTTLTAQLIAFKIGHYYLPVIAIGFILAEAFRGKKTGDVGRIILGFGILFLGMDVISSGLRGLSEAPTVLHLLRSCGSNPVLGVLVGAGVTAIIQSSSLSSRRLAVAQVLVNVLGVAAFLPFVLPYSRLVATTAASLTRQIANAHTFFNVTVTLILLPLVAGLVWLTKRVVPGRETTVDAAPQFLGDEFLNAPAIALEQARKELFRMGELTSAMLGSCRAALLSGEGGEVRTVLETEEAIDALDRTIGNFLDRIDAGELSPLDAKRLHVLEHVTGDIERVGDHAVNIAERAEVAVKEGFTFSQEARRDLADMFDKAVGLYRLSLRALEREDHASAEEALEREKEVDRLEIRYKENHIERLERGTCNPAAGILFVEVLRNLERIGDHAVNIADDVLIITGGA